MEDKESDSGLLEMVEPLLLELEKIRAGKLRQYRWRLRAAALVSIPVVPLLGWIDYMLLMWQRGSDDSVAGITIAFLAALWWWVSSPKRQYASAYKKEILPHIAMALGNLFYRPSGKIPMSEMKPSGIIPSHERYSSEDFFSGEYKGIDIQLAEIHLEQRHRSGKRTYYVTVFKGLVIIMALRKRRFAGRTILIKDQAGVLKWLKEKTCGLERANLVDPRFEQLFDVYTSDQVEARYLIDPLVIENLKKIVEYYQAKGISAAWYDSKMLVLLPSDKNYFEPASIHSSATDVSSVMTLKRELESVLSIADHLDLTMAEHDVALTSVAKAS